MSRAATNYEIFTGEVIRFFKEGEINSMSLEMLGFLCNVFTDASPQQSALYLRRLVRTKVLEQDIENFDGIPKTVFRYPCRTNPLDE